MRIDLLQSPTGSEYRAAKDREAGVLIYTYDPAEQALACAMYLWCDQVFGESCFTHQFNAERAGYPLPAHCEGFDLYCSKATMRKILSSWRKVFEIPADLVAVDAYVGRG